MIACEAACGYLLSLQDYRGSHKVGGFPLGFTNSLRVPSVYNTVGKR